VYISPNCLGSPHPTEFYEIWQTKSGHRHYHVGQILNKLFQGLRGFATPKIATSAAASPLQQCTHYCVTLWYSIPMWR